MTPPISNPGLAELAKKKRGVRQRAKRNRVLVELRDAEAFLRGWRAGDASRSMTCAKALTLACSINSAIRLITQLKTED